MAGCMMCATAAPQSTMIHSPLSSPSMRGFGKPASRTASITLEASALVWRLEVPEATITRSNKGDGCSVLKTWMSWPFTSSRPSTMALWSFCVSFLAAVSVVIRSGGSVKGMGFNITGNGRLNQSGDVVAPGQEGTDFGGALGHLRQLQGVHAHAGQRPQCFKPCARAAARDAQHGQPG